MTNMQVFTATASQQGEHMGKKGYGASTTVGKRRSGKAKKAQSRRWSQRSSEVVTYKVGEEKPPPPEPKVTSNIKRQRLGA